MSVSDWLTTTVPNLEQRPYQLEAWEALINARKHGDKRALIHLATGLGKTMVAAVDALHYIQEENPTAKVLFVSHMLDISNQARATFHQVNPQVTGKFTTFQGLFRRLDSIDPHQYDYIVWDEAHHSEAETFKAVRRHFKPKFELALTATPERADGRDILNYFGTALYSKSLAEGIAEGWLSAVDYHIVFDDAVKKAIGKKFEAKTLKDIRTLFTHRVRNEQIAQEVLQRRHTIGLDKAKTIVFCQNIEAAGDVAKLLAGEVYHSLLPANDRAQVLTRFRNGHLQVICTVDMFNEGIDIPDARLVVFLRSTSSRTIFEQQLGRGLRRHPGKDTVTVLDFVANVERINFVRNLGHTISTHRGSGTAYSGCNKGSGERTPHANPYLLQSNFVFEDQTIELLNRYHQIKSLEYLKTADVVAAYEKMGTVQEVANHFGVSWTAINRHLKQAGVDTTTHRSRSIPTAEVAAVFKELGTMQATGKRLGMGKDTVKRRLLEAGVPPNVAPGKKYASPELIAAFEQYGSVRGAAKALGLDPNVARKRLNNSGVSTEHRPQPPHPSQPLATAPTPRQLEVIQAYERYQSGTLAGATLGLSANSVYKHLRKAGYSRHGYNRREPV